MSTKSSIACGENFHLYNECTEDDCVYLKLEKGAWFETTPGAVTVRIPIAIWEYIRKHPGRDLTLADKSNDEIRAMVEKEVDEQIKDWKESRSSKNKLWRSLLASSGAGKPRQVQLARGLKFRLAERAEQRRILAKVRRFEWEATDEGREEKLKKWRKKHPREVRSMAATFAWIRRKHPPRRRKRAGVKF